MRRHRPPIVPADLQRQVTDALAAVARAEAELGGVSAGAPVLARRAAHAALTRAFDAADGALRRATAVAQQHSRHEWAIWRHRLTRLDTARQIHLLAERDDPGVLQLGTVRAIDTGMSGPAIGDLLHGESREPGTPARYGLDLEAVLTGIDRAEPAAEQDAVVIALPLKSGQEPSGTLHALHSVAR